MGPDDNWVGDTTDSAFFPVQTNKALNVHPFINVHHCPLDLINSIIHLRNNKQDKHFSANVMRKNNNAKWLDLLAQGQIVQSSKLHIVQLYSTFYINSKVKLCYINIIL